MGFAARWLSDSLRLGLGLILAIASMQVPAIADAYGAALVQAAGELRRDIDARVALARQYYGMAEGDDTAAIAALAPREPANAEGLRASLGREAALREARARIEAAPGLLRPVVAAIDVVDDPQGNKWPILRTALDLHEPRLLLNAAAATYGLLGLVLGLFLANAVLSVGGAGRRAPPAGFAARPR